MVSFFFFLVVVWLNWIKSVCFGLSSCCCSFENSCDYWMGKSLELVLRLVSWNRNYQFVHLCFWKDLDDCLINLISGRICLNRWNHRRDVLRSRLFPFFRFRNPFFPSLFFVWNDRRFLNFVEIGTNTLFGFFYCFDWGIS